MLWEVKELKKTTVSRFEDQESIQDGPISSCNGPKIALKGSKRRIGQTRGLNRKKELLEMKSEKGDGFVNLTLPLATISEANPFEPWRKRHARHKEQQRAVALALNPLKGYVALPCRVQLVRYAPKELDTFDNLPMSFKYIVDAVCSIITGEYRPGKADSDKRISISCDQVKSKIWGIKVEITF